MKTFVVIGLLVVALLFGFAYTAWNILAKPQLEAAQNYQNRVNDLLDETQ